MGLQKADLGEKNKVLIAYSGGPSSTLLLNLTQTFHESSSHKKFADVEIINIDESSMDDRNIEVAKKISEVANKSNFNYTQLKLESILEGCSQEFKKHLLFDGENPNSTSLLASNEEVFKHYISSIQSKDSVQDSIKNIKLRLILQHAKDRNCGLIFFGDNSTRIACQSIAMASKGRGYSFPIDFSLSTSWYNGFVIIKPLKDILVKEIGIYNKLNNLDSFPFFDGLEKLFGNKVSIDKLTEDFIIGLDVEFPSTVSTIFKTITKATTSVNDTCLPCKNCLGPIKSNCDIWLASHSVTRLETITNPVEELEVRNIELCYSCLILKNAGKLKHLI
ncbi:Cytoplasmic tRNA 2-thiolation protein 2 [Lobulomyces angularis]|nr:Cytoplasmic tRNA 2-thiolation protein 2 [Lobulomyces angularis]